MTEEIKNSDCYCEEVIICRKERRGFGIEGSPIRTITQVYNKKGGLIAEYDSWEKEQLAKKDLIIAELNLALNEADKRIKQLEKNLSQ